MKKNKLAEQLRPLLEQHALTYRQAAHRLGITVGSVAGLADRHDIKTQSPYASPTKEGTHHMRAKPQRPKSTYNPPVITDRDALTAPDATPVRASAWLPLPGSNPIACEHHRPGQCRWPIGDDRLFCGAPVEEGHDNYCSTHHRMGVRLDPLKPIKLKGLSA